MFERRLAESRYSAEGRDSDPLARILLRTRRRAAGVGGATAACLLLAALLLFGMSSGLILGFSFRETSAELPLWIRPTLLLAAAVGAALSTWRFLLIPLKDVRSDEHTAALLESRLPESTGLASAVEFRARLTGGKAALEEPDYSVELAQSHIERMATIARKLDPARAVPTLLLRRAGWALVGAVTLHSLATLAMPDSIGRGYRLLLSGNGGQLFELEGTSSIAELITGDIELTYNYPAYTSLPPRTVTGTGGDIRALRGTEVMVRTRADRDVDKAAMLVEDTRAVPLSVTRARELEGRLLVADAGHYRFRFMDGRGRNVAEGPSHRITVEADEYPDIEVNLPGHHADDEIEIREQERLTLEYRARDDYGLTEIAIAWRVRGGQEHRALIRRANARDRLEGRWSWDLTTLGLAPGDRVAWYLEALDNDTVSGPKRSTTRTRYLKVFSAAEHHRALMTKVQVHWEAMIERLADHLEAPFNPPEGRLQSLDIEEVAVARKLGAEMTELTEAIADTVRELREDPMSPAALVDALDNIEAGLVTANRRFESAVRLFDSHSRVRREYDQGQAARVRAGQDKIISDLENGILYLESLLDKQRLQDLIAMAEEIRDHQRRLTDLAERLRDNPDDETRAAISEEIARIKERIHELMTRMAELARGIRDEHLNHEALEQLREQDDLLTSLDDVQRMLEEGNLDEAMARLLEMASQLDSLISEWRDQDEHFGEERYGELQREVLEFVDELERVKRDQDNLLGEAETLRDRYRRALEDRVDGRLDDLVRRLTELARAGHRELMEITDEVLEQGFGRMDREAVESAGLRLEDVASLLEARDFDEARRMAEQALEHAAMAASSFGEQARHAARFQQFLGQRREDLDAASLHADRARGNAEEIVRSLEQLFPDPSEVFDVSEMRQMAEMSRRQQDVRRRSRELERRMQAMAEQAPLFSPEMERNLQAAGHHMSEASRQLDGNDARGASSQKRAASERLGELQQEMQEAAERGGQGSGIPMPLSGRGRGQGRGGGLFSQEHVEIPDADQYESPEEFRRELLDAMREGTPERYQDQVRRYYEEHVG